MISFETHKKSISVKFPKIVNQVKFFLPLVIANLPLIYFCFRPIGGPHSFRQAQTAFPLQYWDRHGFNVVPSLPIKGSDHQVWILELPVFQWIAYVLHSLTPLPINFCLRSLALFCMISSFYLVLKHVFGLQGTPLLLGIILAEYTPFTMLWGTTGLIDWLALLFSIAAYLIIIQASPTESSRRIILGTFLLVIAYLIKAPTAIFVTIFMVAHPFFRFDNTFSVIVKKIKYYLLATLIAASSVRIWTVWESTLYPASDPRSIWVPNEKTRAWYFGNSTQYSELLQNLGAVFERFFSTVYGVFPTLLLILIAIISTKLSMKTLIPILACTIYVAIFINLNLVHDYYQIPVAFGILSVVVYAVMQVGKLVSQKIFSLIFISASIAIVGVGSSTPYFASQYYIYSLISNSPRVDGCPAPKEVKEPVLLLGGENNPEYLYSCKFEGFMLEDTPIDHNVFGKRREEYRFMYLRSSQPKSDIREYLGRYSVKIYKVDRNWYKLVWNPGIRSVSPSLDLK